MEAITKEFEKNGLNNDHNGFSKEENSRSNGKKNEKTTLRTPADIFEHPSFYSFVLDMPGLDAQNIKVKIENGMILHVSGKKKKKQMEAKDEVVKVIRAERRRARYMRKFTLPGDASREGEDVKATYKDGVLSITVSKKIVTLQLTESKADSETSSNISLS